MTVASVADATVDDTDLGKTVATEPMAEVGQAPPLSLRRDGIVVAALVALILLAFFEVAFLGRTFSTSWTAVGTDGFQPPPRTVSVPNDPVRVDKGASSWQFAPWAVVADRSYRHTSVPLWNPYQGGGAPLAANFQSATFDPLLLPVRVSATEAGWDIAFMLASALGIAAMYLFLRVLALARVPASVGAIVFSLSGFFMLYSNNHFFRVYVYLPVLCGLVVVVARSRKRWPVVAFAAAVAGAALVGMPEATLFVLSAAGAFAVRAIVLPPAGRSRVSVIVRLGGAGLAGLLLAMPLLAPALEYMRLAFSAHDAALKVGLGFDNPRMLLLWVMPLVDGEPMKSFADGAWSGTRNWIGAAALILIALAIASPRTMKRHAGWFFFGLMAVVLLKCYGFPLLSFVGVLPIFVQANFPIFALPLAGFAAAALAAVGAEAVRRGEVRWPVFAGACVLIGVGGALLLRANHDFIAAGQVVHQLKQFFLAAGAATALLVVVLAFKPVWKPLGVLLVVLVELFVLVPRGIYAKRSDPFIDPAWLQALQRRIASTRTTTSRVFATDAKLFPDYAGVYGLQDVRAVDAMYPNRYVRYVKLFVQPEFATRFVGGPYGQHEEKQPAEIEQNPMFDAWGVRYLISDTFVPTDPVRSMIFAVEPPTPTVRPSEFTLDGDSRPVVFVHSGNLANVPLPANASRFDFSYGMAPEAFAPGASDGVVFRVVLADHGRERELWSAAYVPGTDPATPAWRSATVALPAGISSSATLQLRVDPRATSTTDWAGWASMRIASPLGVVGDEQPQYRLVAQSGTTSVWENTDALPRAWIATNITTTPNEDAAVKRFGSMGTMTPTGALHLTSFDPRSDAVVETSSRLPAHACTGDPGSADIERYTPNEVTIRVKAACSGVLVLSDTYFPGWQASVNGKPASIMPTDLLFRGVPIAAGDHVVTFRYRPRSFRTGVALAGLGAAGLVVFASLPALMAIVRRRRE